MKDMVEINGKLADNRAVTIRKSNIIQESDISGVYDNFPVNGEFTLDDLTFFTRGDNNKIYVVNFEDFGYDYSIYCKSGLTKKEVLSIYELIENFEKN